MSFSIVLSLPDTFYYFSSSIISKHILTWNKAKWETNRSLEDYIAPVFHTLKISIQNTGFYLISNTDSWYWWEISVYFIYKFPLTQSMANKEWTVFRKVPEALINCELVIHFTSQGLFFSFFFKQTKYGFLFSTSTVAVLC